MNYGQWAYGLSADGPCDVNGNETATIGRRASRTQPIGGGRFRDGKAKRMAGRNARSDEAKKYRNLYKLARWMRERVEFMMENPTCAYCARRGEYGPAEVVDHIEPHKGDLKLFWNWSNWQSLCRACHDGEKQIEEKGGTMMRFDAFGFPLENELHQ